MRGISGAAMTPYDCTSERCSIALPQVVWRSLRSQCRFCGDVQGEANGTYLGKSLCVAAGLDDQCDLGSLIDRVVQDRHNLSLCRANA